MADQQFEFALRYGDGVLRAVKPKEHPFSGVDGPALAALGGIATLIVALGDGMVITARSRTRQV